MPLWLRSAGTNFLSASQSKRCPPASPPSLRQIEEAAALAVFVATTSETDADLQLATNLPRGSASIVARSSATSKTTGWPVNDQTNLRYLPSRLGSAKSGTRSPGRSRSALVIGSLEAGTSADKAARATNDCRMWFMTVALSSDLVVAAYRVALGERCPADRGTP